MREMIRLLFNKRFRKTFFMFMGFFMQFWWLGKTKKFLHKEKVTQKYKAVAASLGQVHKAVLINGEHVAVKVQ